MDLCAPAKNENPQQKNHCHDDVDSYSKLARTISTMNTTATDVTMIFVGDWIMPYEFPKHLLTDNGP